MSPSPFQPLDKQSQLTLLGGDQTLDFQQRLAARCIVSRRTDKKGFYVLFTPATPRSTQASRVVDR
jgi:hypothetical protein